jgi:hypothetical protein
MALRSHAWPSCLIAAIGICASGCENKAIGRPCDLTVDAGPSQAVYAQGSLDCPSRICAKPAFAPGSPIETGTGAYCTSTCSSDTDCYGQTRDINDPRDKRCRSGFVCAVPFGQGPLCCQKLCLCRDFISPSAGPIAPAECQGGTPGSCS